MRRLLPVLFLLAAAASAADKDSDGDGLTDLAERHKYGTDPARADSDGDGTPDGDWTERREHAYSVRLVVRDNGCGMSPEHLERLFIPFHTTKERGTGLGLVITQKLVAEMGGQLRVESERRKGTDVTIELSGAAGARCG